MEIVLSTSQKLTQVLSTQLMKDLQILQCSTYELERYIYEKANENPLLAVGESEAKRNYEEIMQLATYSETSNRNSFSASGEQLNYMEMMLAEKDSYETYLIEQIPIQQQLCTKDLSILLFLIQSLDERLFLDVELSYVATLFHTSIQHVELMVELLQTFEPVGVGARDYKEFLLLQIDRDLNAPELARTFIEGDLKLVASKSVKQLSKLYHISASEVEDVLMYLKTLQPVITGEKVESTAYVVPDILFQKLEGEWTIHLNRHYLPSVAIDEMYVSLLKSDDSCKTYYKTCLKDALALIQGIDHRDKTLYEIARYLLTNQQAFFEYGVESLQPMRLKDIADTLHVHESTISRAVKGKYIQTPFGIISLHSLFTKGLVNTCGKMDSVASIKKRLKQLVEGENRKKPLSDARLTSLLKDEGIQISRRTVAKYREELGIASSFNRTSI